MTTIPSISWEQTLLSMAREARHSTVVDVPRPRADSQPLARAYEQCTAITSRHSRSFFLASALMSADRRNAMRALYAFCRTCDDIVDEPTGDVAGRLQEWQLQALSPDPATDNPVAVAWADTRLRYRIPPRYAEQLIEGVGRDMCQNRYETFADLAAYAYGVASTVGLMSMCIIGYEGPQAVRYAIKLGVALQMTNILRDVGEDWANDRVYLPAQEMAGYGLGESDLAAGVVSRHWRAFMRFQIARNRRLYAEAWPGIAMLHRDGRLAVAAAAAFYRAILDDIEAHDYDVFSRRAHVSGPGKLRILPGLWWQTARS